MTRIQVKYKIQILALNKLQGLKTYFSETPDSSNVVRKNMVVVLSEWVIVCKYACKLQKAQQIFVVINMILSELNRFNSGILTILRTKP